MNERAREALVAAALAGIRQIQNRTCDDNGGRCATGVILEDYTGFAHWSDIRARRIPVNTETIYAAYGITDEEWAEMIRLNNAGVDFLTIARKLGVPEEAAS